MFDSRPAEELTQSHLFLTRPCYAWFMSGSGADSESDLFLTWTHDIFDSLCAVESIQRLIMFTSAHTACLIQVQEWSQFRAGCRSYLNTCHVWFTSCSGVDSDSNNFLANVYMDCGLISPLTHLPKESRRDAKQTRVLLNWTKAD